MSAHNPFHTFHSANFEYPAPLSHPTATLQSKAKYVFLSSDALLKLSDILTRSSYLSDIFRKIHSTSYDISKSLMLFYFHILLPLSL